MNSVKSSIYGIGSSLSGIGRFIFQNKILSLVIVSIIVIVVLIAVYQPGQILKNNKQYKENKERMSSSTQEGGPAELMFFYADWCPHCKTAKPVWLSLKNEYDHKTVNGRQLQFTEVNCTTETTETSQLMSQYKVEGFPTIKMKKDGVIVDFDAKPTEESLNQFIQTVV
jgi:thiol-disulfide isomerase/thioredoxin